MNIYLKKHDDPMKRLAAIASSAETLGEFIKARAPQHWSTAKAFLDISEALEQTITELKETDNDV